MMDVEKMRKLNTLIYELRKHGISESSDDALVRAQEIIDMKEKRPQPVTATPRVIEEPKLDELKQVERRIGVLIEITNKKYDQQIVSLKDVISALATEIDELKKKVSDLSSDAQVVVKQSVPAAPAQPTQSVNAEVERQISAQGGAHPKQGRWKPEDVAIDKIFYYGK